LESMAEGQVTTDGFTRRLEQPFMIIATQNPVEMAGTFPLPEAQLDRFLIALKLGYPSHDDEVTILEREEHDDPLDAITSAVDLDQIIEMQQAVRAVDVVRRLKDYIVRIVAASRTHNDVALGASPRGGVALQRCAQALALLHNRTYVTPDDIKMAAPAVLAHRMMTRDRRAETAHNVVTEILTQIRVPVE